MTDTEVDRAIKDARIAEQEVFIRDDNGHTVERLNSGPIPSQTETGQEGEESI